VIKGLAESAAGRFRFVKALKSKKRGNVEGKIEAAEADFGVVDFSVEERPDSSRVWVRGTLDGYSFNALLYVAGTTNPAWQIGDSRISKLAVLRIADNEPVFNWDRGLEFEPADERAQRVVDWLVRYLAGRVFGEEK
jgi:hypothetical protein